MTKKKGTLRLTRLFTKEGISPYDEVTWETRTATVGRPGEKPVFEQEGVEVPDFWSQQATNIVAQKYFAYGMDDPRREYSVRQMIDRVVETIATAGVDKGYFDKEEREVFADELRYILLHQLAAFNSPVWFNVGVEGAKPQTSACFILSVDDSLESIAQWYTEEMKIFQRGSGAGVNVSKLRSSDEPLSLGGYSSGPVTFMRAADASAGTIQSGGTTRRAAKMVVMDIDHPDVEDFIWCKAHEEDRIRALRAAGFAMDIDGGAGERNMAEATSYQNANNSVRLSDEFLKAVEDDADWDLTARGDGSVIKTVKARELMRQVSEAAWKCADPGVQYDTTINDWHTTPAQGPITASNPCFPASARVHTTKGLLPIAELFLRMEAGEDIQVYTHRATADNPDEGVLASKPVAVMANGVKDILLLTFSDGRQLRCTPNHRLWTLNRGWVAAESLNQEDKVKLNDCPTPAMLADSRLPVKDLAVAVSRAGGVTVEQALPTHWSEGLGEMMGFLTGDGCMTDHGITWVYGRDDVNDGLIDSHEQIITDLIGGVSVIDADSSKGTKHLRVGSSAVRDMFAQLGVTQARASSKRVPETIFRAPRATQAAYLRGLFTADGCLSRVESGKGSRYIGLGSTSIGLLRDAQKLLSGFGIRARIYQNGAAKNACFNYTRQDGSYVEYDGKPIADLRITGTDLEVFASQINFASLRKKDALDQLLKETNRYRSKDSVSLTSSQKDGREHVFNLTEPLHHSYIVDGIIVANCSEYMSNDNSACNLASLNLLRFLNDENQFDVDAFAHVARIVFTAQEITIAFGHFPTRKIARNSRSLRQIGIGFANLGALLMALGLAYDSDEGRDLAGAITALLTGESYLQSTYLAERVEPFAHFEENRDSVLRVLGKHRGAARKLTKVADSAKPIVRAARAAWEETVKRAEEVGVRNAQASVLAPTGTIAFLMDCDTTGIEPDFSLIKYKSLSGGGSMTIVNQTVPRALRQLGYSHEEIEEIIAYLTEEVDKGGGFEGPRGSVVGAPHLKEEHYSVFDCAIGERAIAPMGHVYMMAACQPFLSGAISKTINMPESASVEEIEEVYLEGGKLGLKAIAVYRDNCKAFQPLGDAKQKIERDEEAEEAVEQRITSLLGDGLIRGERRRVPREAEVVGVHFTVAQTSGYIHARLFEDGRPGAIFIDVGQAGSTLRGFINALAITMSVSLQHGTPLDIIVSKLANMQFEPYGITDDPQIRQARSLVDYFVKWMAAEFLDPAVHPELGINISEQDSPDSGELAPQVKVHAQTVPVEKEKIDEVNLTASSNPLCTTCGTLMVKTGSCYTCPACGTSGGCG